MLLRRSTSTLSESLSCISAKRGYSRSMITYPIADKSTVYGLNDHRAYYIRYLRLMRTSVSSTREPMKPESRPSSELGGRRPTQILNLVLRSLKTPRGVAPCRIQTGQNPLSAMAKNFVPQTGQVRAPGSLTGSSTDPELHAGIQPVTHP